MATKYTIHSVGIERPERYDLRLDPDLPVSRIVVRLQVGKREKLVMITLTEEEALKMASDLLIAAMRQRKKES